MPPNSTCCFVLEQLWFYGCMDVPSPSQWVRWECSSSGPTKVWAAISAHHCRAPVCAVSARYSFYYGRINKRGIARESGEGQQREGSQWYHRVYIVVFLCMCPETQTFGQKWWCHVTPRMVYVCGCDCVPEVLLHLMPQKSNLQKRRMSSLLDMQFGPNWGKKLKKNSWFRCHSSINRGWVHSSWQTSLQ